MRTFCLSSTSLPSKFQDFPLRFPGPTHFTGLSVSWKFYKHNSRTVGRRGNAVHCCLLQLFAHITMLCRYELYAVVCHSGISLSSGHYISYVRAPSANAARALRDMADPEDQSEPAPVWFICNDDVVTAVRESDLKEKMSQVDATTPYMLFYRRMSA